MIHQDLITKGNTDSPTPPATWTGAAKVDMSKDGWKDRIQEYATAEFLEANGMDADLAKTVASTTNAKIKAKKAKKEEKTKAIESTAQTVLAVAAMVLTAGAAAPAVAGTATATTAATTTASFTSTIASAISSGISTVGAVLTGTASLGSYVQVASIALQAGIGSRTGGVEGAMAGAANGILQAFAGSLGTKEAGALKDKADEIGQQVNAGLMNMDEGVAALEAAKNAAKLANVGAKTLAATNVSYTKEDGWGIKANVTGLLSAVGVTQGGYGGSLLQRLTNVTIGQSQRGGASVNLGFNTPIGNMGINYTGATGTFGGSYDIMERQVGGLNLSSELSYDGKEGLSVSGNADFGNGLGLGIENGRNGTTGSLTLLGSTQGTVNEDGIYEANANFLGEISGQDIIDLHNTIAQQEGNATIEDAARNAPAKSAKDAANSNNPVDDIDNDAQEEAGSQGSEGLVDLVFAGTAVLVSAGAVFLAGGSSSATPTTPAGGQSGAGNGGNATIARKPEDDEPPKKKRTKEELANFKDNVFLNTTRAVTDDYLNKLDAQGVDTKEMRAHAEAQRAAGVRDLTPAEIQAKRLEKELAALRVELDKASDVASFEGSSRLDVGPSLIQQLESYRKDIQDKIEAKTKELGLIKESVSSEGKSSVTARGGKEGESNSNLSQNGNAENTPSKAVNATDLPMQFEPPMPTKTENLPVLNKDTDPKKLITDLAREHNMFPEQVESNLLRLNGASSIDELKAKIKAGEKLKVGQGQGATKNFITMNQSNDPAIRAQHEKIDGKNISNFVDDELDRRGFSPKDEKARNQVLDEIAKNAKMKDRNELMNALSKGTYNGGIDIYTAMANHYVEKMGEEKTDFHNGFKVGDARLLTDNEKKLMKLTYGENIKLDHIKIRVVEGYDMEYNIDRKEIETGADLIYDVEGKRGQTSHLYQSLIHEGVHAFQGQTMGDLILHQKTIKNSMAVNSTGRVTMGVEEYKKKVIYNFVASIERHQISPYDSPEKFQNKMNIEAQAHLIEDMNVAAIKMLDPKNSAEDRVAYQAQYLRLRLYRNLWVK